MTLEILTLIAMLCNITALEDSKSKWTEIHKVEKYQNKCRVYYVDCYLKGKGILVLPGDQISHCLKKRKP